MLVDTGATYTCASPKYAMPLPKSDKFAKTVGFLGQAQLIPVTAPVSLTPHNKTMRIPILISEHTPINLLGCDALCDLGFKIWCTPDSVYVDEFAIKSLINLLGKTHVLLVVEMWRSQLI